MSSEQDQGGMMRITTEREANGQRARCVLVLLLVLSVVAWGVGYKASLYSIRSVARHSIPPARLLAHRACLECSGVLPGRVRRPVKRVLSLVILSEAPSITATLHAFGPVVGAGEISSARLLLQRTGLPRPPPTTLA